MDNASMGAKGHNFKYSVAEILSILLMPFPDSGF